jgi:hypothetical protein
VLLAFAVTGVTFVTDVPVPPLPLLLDPQEKESVDCV